VAFRHQEVDMFDAQVDFIDRVCAKERPLRLGATHSFPVKCEPLEHARRDFLEARYPFGSEDDSRRKVLADGLCQFGGSFVLIPGPEEDLEKILVRGQLWGPTGKILRGEQSQCHSNSVKAWEANQDKLYLATGYAMSSDGLWRQHSWCVNPKPRSIQIVETTERRSLYFGFVMTLDETVDFGYNNTFSGVDVDPQTYARYGLEVPVQIHAERPRA
jgi:hypothetical protein